MSRASRSSDSGAQKPKASPATERREQSGERRDDRARRTLEMILDGVFRPARWAANTAYSLGFQTGRPVDVQRLLIPVHRPAGSTPLRVAFATDFHAGATTSTRVLEQACQALQDLQADVLLLGGDFVSVRAGDIDELAPLLSAIRAPLGKFGVFGNHDLRANRKTLDKALSAAGVRMLINENVRLGAPHADITVSGLDDPIRGAPLPDILDEVDGIRVVLMHAPDGLLSIADRHFDLAVCGHTHGGQVTIPGVMKPYLPSGKLSRTYSDGLYRLDPAGARALLVSRGVGCSTIPIRIGARAQVHLFTIG